MGGFEPPRISAPGFESGVSANSTTLPCVLLRLTTYRSMVRAENWTVVRSLTTGLVNLEYPDGDSNSVLEIESLGT